MINLMIITVFIRYFEYKGGRNDETCVFKN